MKKILLFLLLLLLLASCTTPLVAETSDRPLLTPMETPTPTPSQEAPPCYPDPITGFFASDNLPTNTTYEINAHCWMVANAWEEEVGNIYDVLRVDASPALPKMGIDLDLLEADFYRFVDAQAELEAYFYWSDAFGDKGSRFGEHIVYGSGFSGGKAVARQALLREHVKSWYSDFVWLTDQTPLDYYVFDPQTIRDLLTEQNPNHTLTVGDYTLDPASEPPDEVVCTPIDEWITEHASTSGITLEIGIDAARATEIWEKELLHAYNLLSARAHPTNPEPRQALEDARDALLNFAPAYGWSAALYTYSDAFKPELWAQHPETILPGSIVGPASSNITMRYYRQITLRLWEMLYWDPFGTKTPDYAFDPAEYE